MTAFFIISLIFVIIYSIEIFVFYYAWHKHPAHNTTKISPAFFISVIVPVRNESANIGNLLNDLSKQNYEKENFEILVINDHSDDETFIIASNLASKSSNLHVFNLNNYEHGKKSGIKYGVTQAKGDLIITIDGDCRVKSNWLSSIASCYASHKVQLIIGPVLYYDEKSLFDYMQSLEIAALVASGAGAAVRKKPVMCNGANLAFTKEIYLQSFSDLKPNIASGDDLFLLLAIKKNNPDHIHFLKSFDAAVYTKPAGSIKDFYKQRKRWSSKWVHYRDIDILLLALKVFLCSFILCVCLFMSFFNLFYLLYFVFFLLIKSFADIMLINSFTSFFKKKNIMRYFWLTQLVYPFYVVFTAILGNVGKLEWKKRKY